MKYLLAHITETGVLAELFPLVLLPLLFFGFTPIAVLIFDRGWNTGPATNGIERVFGGLALAGYNVYDSGGNMAISITSNGFIVSVNYSAYTNMSGHIYHYITFK